MASPRAPYDELTARELEILRLMARGLTNGQIAERLDIGFETAKTHVSHIIAKTGAATREEAVANWRAWNRSGARARRWIGGPLGAVPRPVKLGLGAVAVVAVAAVVLLFWPSGSDDGTIAADVTVQYLLQVGNEREAFLPLPFEEALHRLAHDAGFPTTVPRSLPGDRDLTPTDVYVRLSGLGPGGFHQFGVRFKSVDDAGETELSIQVEREVFIGRDGPTEWDEHRISFQPQGLWKFTQALSDTFEVAYTDGSLRSDITSYIAWRSGSLYRTTLTISGPEQLTHEQAMAILESVLGQE